MALTLVEQDVPNSPTVTLRPFALTTAVPL
jgi:hypothetical protein